ncbi:MAG: PspC domain-containing protein [Candidatus Paceibacterota bacterium]|jgi:phage shock protein PspC (stress-responsive transcriptional regulator)
MEYKKLLRSKKDRVIAGVCGGLGIYFNVDPVLLRLIWLLLVIMTGIFPGILVYLVAILVVPLEPDQSVSPK